jgi:hypothetical protein
VHGVHRRQLRQPATAAAATATAAGGKGRDMARVVSIRGAVGLGEATCSVGRTKLLLLLQSFVLEVNNDL